ncbi:MAG: hypothetical protein M3680_12790 [Myxococcota bacterium]|nr:hypothetical protein [Myxococcota bacterium]
MPAGPHERAFERVYTMTDYYDGPRRGIASFDGRPHAYASVFDHVKDGDAEIYELRAVDEDTFARALEDWAIWLRWDDAFHAGLTTIETHPALPADRARHDALAPVLAASLAALPGPVVQASGVFRPSAGHTHGGGGRWLEVQWSPLGDA